MLDVSPEHAKMLRDILAREIPGVTVWAFGSRVAGTPKPHSDLDLALLAKGAVPWSRLARLEEELAESDLPFRVDIVDLARASEAFRKIIEEQHEAIQDAG